MFLSCTYANQTKNITKNFVLSFEYQTEYKTSTCAILQAFMMCCTLVLYSCVNQTDPMSFGFRYCRNYCSRELTSFSWKFFILGLCSISVVMMNLLLHAEISLLGWYFLIFHLFMHSFIFCIFLIIFLFFEFCII